LCELLFGCAFDGLVYQLIRHGAARNFDPLVGFVRREIGASIIVVMNILAVGARAMNRKAARNVSWFVSLIVVSFFFLYLSNPIDFSYSALAVQKASKAF
jgi:hypothetical protein